MRRERVPARVDATAPQLVAQTARGETPPSGLLAGGAVHERGPRASVSLADRLSLTPVEAAVVLGMSRDSFDRHVLPEIRVVRRGRLVLVPVKELERWVERSAAITVEIDRW
jgi:hypothetical protein